MQEHLMIDFETLGTGERCAVVSLGAVMFNKEGIHSKKEWNFDLQEQEDIGRAITVSTVSWWMKQSPGARKVFTLPGKTWTLREWIEDLDAWYIELGIDPKDILIWSNGGDFDIPIYCDIFRHLKMKDPIPYWGHRCFRTADAIFKLKDKHQRKGTFHNALDDSIYQAECLIKLWQKGKK